MSCSVFWSRFAASLKQAGLEYARPGKSLAVEGGSRLHESEEQRSRRHGDSRLLEVRGERLPRSVMEQGVLGSSLTVASWRWFLFSGRLGSS